MLEKLFVKFFPNFVARVIHQAAGTKRGDDILKNDSPIVAAAIQITQPLIIKAGQTIEAKVAGPLNDIVKKAISGGLQ